MSHLSLETLARLVDETPSPVESAHLEHCEACRQELDGLRADAAALAALPDVAPAAGSWSAVEARLATEGLIASPLRHRNRFAAAMLRMAAGVILFAMGTGTGLLLASSGDASPPPAVASIGDAAAASDANDSPGLVTRGDQDAERAGAATPTEPQPLAAPRQPEPPPAAIVPEPRRPVRLASTTPMPAFDAPRNADEALSFMRDAETKYLEALMYYAEQTGAFDSGDPAARLAALEGIVLTTRAALGQAPADPIINGYHMTALAQREATLRQIAAASSNTWF